jgi:hypothetical protein
MNEQEQEESPKLFISYSWSSPEHEQWVLTLATELRDSGVDVILDKWDLREGHDAHAFMERMVSDPNIKKVILVCDHVYAEKADGRSGGVGTEAQIITPEIYGKQDQDKFVAVVAEKDENNAPYVPIYYKSRIYIDLSDPDRYATNFEQLLRWVYGQPVYIKPELGKKPAFLDESAAINLGTSTQFRRALDAVRNGKAYSRGAVIEYFAALIRNMERFRLSDDERELDDRVIENIEQFLPYRNEAVEIFQALAQYQNLPDMPQYFHRLFEGLIPYLFRPAMMPGGFQEGSIDNFRFIIHELFLYAVANLLRYENFEAVGHLLRTPYYMAGSDRRTEAESYIEIRKHMKSLEIRDHRLNLRRLSLRADLLKQRAEAFGFDFSYLMQADFVLYLRSCIEVMRQERTWSYWWPETLLYSLQLTRRERGLFEIFARSQSQKYFDRMKVMFDAESKGDFDSLIQFYQEQPGTLIPRWQWESVDPSLLMGYSTMATKP